MIKQLFLVTITVFLASFSLLAQKTEVVQIKTSAECGTCKKAIESKMNYHKGVTYAELNVDTKVLEIKYNPKKTDLQTLKTAISHLGYDADEVEAHPESQAQLPTCCKPGGMK